MERVVCARVRRSRAPQVPLAPAPGGSSVARGRADAGAVPADGLDVYRPDFLRLQQRPGGPGRRDRHAGDGGGRRRNDGVDARARFGTDAGHRLPIRRG